MHVLVTGAFGFLGSHLVKDLLTRDFHVKAFIRKSSDWSNLNKI
jgi:thioester reductase-like protein